MSLLNPLRSNDGVSGALEAINHLQFRLGVRALFGAPSHISVLGTGASSNRVVKNQAGDENQIKIIVRIRGVARNQILGRLDR